MQGSGTKAAALGDVTSREMGTPQSPFQTSEVSASLGENQGQHVIKL
jgi:hypothetical protein